MYNCLTLIKEGVVRRGGVHQRGPGVPSRGAWRVARDGGGDKV